MATVEELEVATLRLERARHASTASIAHDLGNACAHLCVRIKELKEGDMQILTAAELERLAQDIKGGRVRVSSVDRVPGTSSGLVPHAFTVHFSRGLL